MNYTVHHKGRVLTITDGAEGDDSTLKETFRTYEDGRKSYRIYGVYGTVEYNDASALIVVDRAEAVGHVGDAPVYEIKGVRIIMLGNKREQLLYERLIQFFQIPGLYFSNYRLYLRNQAIDGSTPKENNDFLFNRHPLKLYLCSHRHFTIRCIQGYFGSYGNLCLISRRSPGRAGVRYFSRGCDSSGECSNFVETEQFVDRISSYTQLRGSIPLLWGHSVGWKYYPSIIYRKAVISETQQAHCKKDARGSCASKQPGEFTPSTADGFITAKKLLRSKYDEEIVYLNLINEHGYEGELCSRFKKALENEHAYHYNFHRCIGKVDFPFDVMKTGFSRRGEKQRMIIRTNCIDCLDRTNSMQYIIGAKILEHQARKDPSAFKDMDSTRRAFKEMFYKNGNYLSIQYSGTPALLAGHILGTRQLNKLQDGYFSLKRYFINRFKHGEVQMAYDVLCGKGRRASKPVTKIIEASVWSFVIIVLISWGVRCENPASLTAIGACILFIFFLLATSLMDCPTIETTI